ncbi:meiotic nuclear division protein 1 homolog isoform X1 [Echeneis naucrates]|uniref:meiotic nuclear division protein 1 homolog isoform X1 n=1 Tax=Echeneis naucrates TaxID=173247 RepID=UPI001113AA70|nr:meiotic nuclear division protein 1 homolog isoform X1 [Echeneis naucrates]
MSKKKGLSLEEKRTRMMEIFFESKDVFQLKDIEKIAPKTKGIAPMTVKEVLQSLVDDNMVDCERVGTSNYYWAFPSKALNARKNKLEELQKQISEANQRKMSLQTLVEKAKVGRHNTDERSSLLKELQALREEQTQLQAELEKYRECDPEVIEEMRVKLIQLRWECVCSAARLAGGRCGEVAYNSLKTSPAVTTMTTHSGIMNKNACLTAWLITCIINCFKDSCIDNL